MHIVSSKTTPLVLARLTLRPLQPIDYLTQLLDLSRRPAHLHPSFLRLPLPQPPFRGLLRSLNLSPLPLPHFLANCYSLANTRTPHAAVICHILCAKSPLPNAFGTRNPVPSKLNIPVWKSYLEHYSDSVVADFLAFGWPINCHSVVSVSSQPPNHASATKFPGVIDAFLSTELGHSATAGPFTCNPFPAPIRTSPLQTVPKNGTKRRVVLDLSFPPGSSVNDGIPTDSYLDQPFHLSLPLPADFVDLILSKGPGCFLYKKDLKCAYRQIPVDPRDYILLAYHWSDSFYFDLVLPFGLHSATLACQRTIYLFIYLLSCHTE